VVIPKNYKHLLEKQINSFYTDAIIEETTEVNIFKDKKYISSTYLNTSKEYFFPFKTYTKLESDPINNITNAFSKLEEDESAVIQILVKPIDDDWQGKSSKASSKIMNGKKSSFTLNPFKLIFGVIQTLFESQDKDNTPNKNDSETSALSQERAKTVDEK
jgi:hypothetical protein